METARIADIAEINPRVPRELIDSPEREVNFVPMSHLSERGEITCNGTRPLREVLKGYTYFANGDVIVAKITPCMENGKAALVRDLPCGVAFGSTEFHVLRPRPMVEPRYLFYMLWSPAFRHAASQNMTGTAGQKRVPASFIQRFEFPLPPLGEQKRIADILEKADEINAKQRWLMTDSARLTTACFLEMFGTSSRSAAGLGRLADVADIASGVAKGRAFNGTPTVTVPYLRVANVQAGFLDLAELKTIEALPHEVSALALRRDDVVMTEGGDHDKLGRGALWDVDIPNCIHQNHIFRVRTDRSKMLPLFFVTYLQTEPARRYFLRAAKKTSNLATINMRQLKALPVPIPPLDVQQRFAETALRSRALGQQNASRALTGERLLASLAWRAFSGSL